MTLTRPRTPADAASPFEILEPRRLLNSHTFEPFAEGLGLDPTILDLAAGGAVSLANIGDVDGDGADDLVVGFAADTMGIARVYSGRTGEILFERSDGEEEFGFAVAGLGDVTGDGTPDFAVGSPNAWTFGRAYIYSGADGSLVRELSAPVLAVPDDIPDRLGHAIALLGDIDNDGIGDVLVGAPGAFEHGQAHIFSGATGENLRTFNGASHGDEFGFAVADAGLLPGDDGVRAVLIGAPGAANLDIDLGGEAGIAYLYDAATGELIETWTGDHGGDRLGHAVAATTLAGRVTVYFGAPGFDAEGPGGVHTDAGQVRSAIPGTSVGVPWSGTPAAGARLGSSLVALHNLTTADVTDLAATAPGAGAAGQIVLFMAFDGTPMFFDGALPAAADVNGDGLLDLVHIAPGADAGDAPRLIARNNLTFDRLGEPSAASPNLDFVVFGTSRILIERGVGAVRFSDVPNLDGAIIVDINDHGHILADNADGSPFVLIDGQRTDIPAGITQAVGADLTDAPFTPIGIGNGGHVLLQQTLADRTISWLFKDGVLTFLWNGFVSEVNTAGAILGTRFNPGDAMGTTVLRAADGTVTDLPTLFNAAHLADDNAVAALDAAGGVVLWQNGETTLITDHNNFGQDRVVDLTTGRRLLYTRLSGQQGAPIRNPFFYTPTTGSTQIRGLISNPADLPDPTSIHRPRPDAIAADGTILTSEGVLTTIDPAELTTPAPGAPLIPLAAGDTITTITINTLGQLMAARTDAAGRPLPSGPVTRIVTSPDNTPIHVGDRPFTAFIEPRTGRAYIVATVNNTTALLLLSEDTATASFERDFPYFTSPGGSPQNPWASDLITFTSADGRVHLAGRHTSGDWVMFYQTGAADPLGRPSGDWSVSNLTDEHLAPQGLTLPDLTGVTAYVTPWNALNIVGIDDTGDVHALWWAPGLVTQTSTGLWRTDNLSRAARDHAARFALPLTIPKLQGNLTAFVTPWNAIHIAGTTTGVDATPEPKPVGEIGVLWWAPTLGEAWTADVLKNVPHEGGGGSPSFQPGSLTSLVTPWGGLAIFGIATTELSQPGLEINPGEIAVFWWSAPTDGPGDTWNLASLSDAATFSPPGPTVTAPLAALTTPAGGQHLFTTHDSTGALLAFSWTPTSPTWTFTTIPFTFIQL